MEESIALKSLTLLPYAATSCSIFSLSVHFYRASARNVCRARDIVLPILCVSVCPPSVGMCLKEWTYRHTF